MKQGKVLLRVPMIEIPICPFCHTPLRPSTHVCRLKREKGAEVHAERRLSYCNRCDVWFKCGTLPTITTAKQKKKSSIPEMEYFSPNGKSLETVKRMCFELDKCQAMLISSQNAQEHTTIFRRQVAKVPPVVKVEHSYHTVPITNGHILLKDELVEKYQLPDSMITIVLCQSETCDLQQRFVLVDNPLDEDVERNFLFVNHIIAQKILRCIASGKHQFSWQRKNHTEYMRIVHYFVGEALEMRQQRRQELLSLASQPDKLIEISVYRRKGLCPQHGDRVERVAVYVSGTHSDELHPIEVYYCPVCDEYYVGRAEVDRFIARYGLPPFRLYDDSDWDVHCNFGKRHLREHSILAVYGYGVGKNSDLSSNDRKRLLEGLIQRKILTKAQIVSHLEYLCAFNENNPVMIHAIPAWADDLDFLTQELMDTNTILCGKFVQPNK